MPLYRRKEGSPENPVWKDGYVTNATNRRRIIIERAEAVYRLEWDIWCPHTVGEFQTFVTRPDGKEAAAGAAHDDDMLAIAIGRYCLPGGRASRNGAVSRCSPRAEGSHLPARRVERHAAKCWLRADDADTLLSRFTVLALNPTPAVHAILQRWGIETFGRLTALPAADLQGYASRHNFDRGWTSPAKPIRQPLTVGGWPCEDERRLGFRACR